MKPDDFKPASPPVIKGYRGFFSLLWMLFQENRHAHRLGIKYKFEIELPVRWRA